MEDSIQFNVVNEWIDESRENTEDRRKWRKESINTVSTASSSLSLSSSFSDSISSSLHESPCRQHRQGQRRRSSPSGPTPQILEKRASNWGEWKDDLAPVEHRSARDNRTVQSDPGARGRLKRTANFKHNVFTLRGRKSNQHSQFVSTRGLFSRKNSKQSTRGNDERACVQEPEKKTPKGADKRKSHADNMEHDLIAHFLEEGRTKRSPVSVKSKTKCRSSSTSPQRQPTSCAVPADSNHLSTKSRATLTVLQLKIPVTKQDNMTLLQLEFEDLQL